MFSPKLYNEDYVSITKTSNSKAIQGLLNYKTQEVILEAKYEIFKANNTFYCVQENQKSPYKIYRFSDHKKLKTENFLDVVLYDDYFLVAAYVDEDGNHIKTEKEIIRNNRKIRSIKYNYKGEKITYKN